MITTNDRLNSLVNRLNKISITIELISNYPWIYLLKVNDNLVKEKYESNHHYTIMFHPKIDDATFLDIEDLFKTIKKYK